MSVDDQRQTEEAIESRRTFLQRGAAIAGAAAVGFRPSNDLHAAATVARRAGGSPIYHGYVTCQDENRIRTFTMDAETGAIAWLADVPLSGGPALLAMDPGR